MSRNPDERTRRLERAAASGDPEAQRALEAARSRAHPVRGTLWVGPGGVLEARRYASGVRFRAPHYSVSRVAAIGEVGKARDGVLLLDEVDQFRPAVLEAIHAAIIESPQPPYVWATIHEESKAYDEAEKLPGWLQHLSGTEFLRHPLRNPDDRTRELGRRWKATGDTQLGVAYLAALRRAPEDSVEWEREETAVLEAVGDVADFPNSPDGQFARGRRVLRKKAQDLVNLYGALKTQDLPGREAWVDYSGATEVWEVTNWLDHAAPQGLWGYAPEWSTPHHAVWYSSVLWAFVSLTEGDLGVEINASPTDYAQSVYEKRAFYGEA